MSRELIEMTGKMFDGSAHVLIGASGGGFGESTVLSTSGRREGTSQSRCTLNVAARHWGTGRKQHCKDWATGQHQQQT